MHGDWVNVSLLDSFRLGIVNSIHTWNPGWGRWELCQSMVSVFNGRWVLIPRCWFRAPVKYCYISPTKFTENPAHFI